MRPVLRSRHRLVSSLCVAALTVGALGCHATLRYQDTRTGESRTTPGTEPRPRAPTVRLDDQGRLRFLEPLVCSSTVETDVATFDVERTRPNPAAVVVGVIAIGAGVVAAARGLRSDAPASSAFTYVGLAGIGVGLPLAIGPFFGTSTARNPIGTQVVRRPGPEVECGERGLAAGRAVVLWNGLHVEGGVDRDGYFAVAGFDFVDAFEPKLPPLDLAVDLDSADGKLRLDKIVDAHDLAAARAGFFAARGVDGAVPPVQTLEKLPQLEPGRLGVVLAPGRLRVSLPIDNVGPGPSYGLRAVLASSSAELDGRVLYLGHLPARGRGEFTAEIPLSPEAEREVVGATFTIAALVRDGHGLAPSTPVRFRGVVLRTGS